VVASSFRGCPWAWSAAAASFRERPRTHCVVASSFRKSPTCFDSSRMFVLSALGGLPSGPNHTKSSTLQTFGSDLDKVSMCFFSYTSLPHPHRVSGSKCIGSFLKAHVSLPRQLYLWSLVLQTLCFPFLWIGRY